MRTIWKYPLDVPEEVTVLQVPQGATVLTADFQERRTPNAPYADLCVWFAVDDDRALTERRFAVLTTGNPVPAQVGDLALAQGYVATVQRNGYVLHVFEV
jgi:hypothetical protein